MSEGKRYVIPPAPQAALAVAGSTDLFPVRRIWCVGRNYLEHIKEMGQDEREPPFFFAKPADALVPDNGTSPYPSLTKDMHHEVELVVALKSGGRNIPVDKALDCVWGYGVGIDLTRRDLQIASRDIKRPWEVGKAFDASAPCGATLTTDHEAVKAALVRLGDAWPRALPVAQLGADEAVLEALLRAYAV